MGITALKIFLYIFGFLALIILGLYVMAYPQFGKTPSKVEQKKFLKSDQFEPSTGTFFNIDKEAIKRMQARFFTLEFVKEQLKGFEREVRPKSPLPETPPSFDSFLTLDKNNPEATFKVIWFGHSSFLLNMGGSIVLVDPVFGAASPLFFGGSRFQKSIVNAADLPDVDVILISHDHYDHLETETIRYFSEKKTTFVVPLGVGSLLKSWGVNPSAITELNWHASTSLDNLTITATPSQHFSGRQGFNGNKTLWASFVLTSNMHNIYISGDSGYADHFKSIGQTYGPFDLAFIENGQYNITWQEVHLLPHETVQAYLDLKAHRLFPVHWGMFTLAPHDWYDPIKQLSELAKPHNIPLVTPIIGETIQPLSDAAIYKEWWAIMQNKAVAR